MWYQKSRAKWIQLGDRNTKYFYMSTITSRIHNKIKRLKIEGSWVDDSDLVKCHVVDNFKKLFSKDCNVVLTTSVWRTGPTIGQNTRDFLSSRPNDLEIKKTTFFHVRP